MTIEDRVMLARAQGWCQFKQDDFHFPAGRIGVGPIRSLPDPETNPADLLELIEWVRKQPWYRDTVISAKGTAIYTPETSYLFHGSFNQEFPKAVVTVIKEMEKK